MATESLDDVLKALHNAVIEAQQLTEHQHIRQLNRYFRYKDPAGNDLPEGSPEYGMPRLKKFKVPDLRKEHESEWRDIDVPSLSLAPPSAIGIRELRLRFSVSVGASEKELEGRSPVTNQLHRYRGPLTTEFGKETGANVAEIDMTFEKTEVPEAFHRITDLLGKTIP